MNLEEAINNLDLVGNFGFSQNFGAADQLPAMRKSQATNYTVNPAIKNATQGTSTLQISITVAKTGTGSGNSANPVYLFGGDALTNTSKGYTAVSVNNPVQTTSFGFTNNKNTLVFRYGTDTNNATYTVSLSTDGEYPFALNSLSGKKFYNVKGIQMDVANAAHVAQLSNAIKTFELNEFGKATTNDLTTPKDLYQQQTNGIFIPHVFPISGRKGIILNVNETDTMVLNLYTYVDTNPPGGCAC